MYTQFTLIPTLQTHTQWFCERISTLKSLVYARRDLGRVFVFLFCAYILLITLDFSISSPPFLILFLVHCIISLLLSPPSPLTRTLRSTRGANERGLSQQHERQIVNLVAFLCNPADVASIEQCPCCKTHIGSEAVQKLPCLDDLMERRADIEAVLTMLNEKIASMQNKGSAATRRTQGRGKDSDSRRKRPRTSNSMLMWQDTCCRCID